MESLAKTKTLKKTTTIPLQITVVDGGLIALPIQETLAMTIVGVVTAAGIVAAAEIDIALKKAVLHCVHALADWRTVPLSKKNE